MSSKTLAEKIVTIIGVTTVTVCAYHFLGWWGVAAYVGFRLTR